ncbi:paraquat-inducible protein A [Pedobacter chitinilyticus]|uniref:2-methylisocitrate lyase n=1 Tax=Pedobacter chitinilyticus TaxID=2233776 RepID=A0A3S3PID5_9SPHI|nr:paraquat-inducible protein A [Pedobacter chitinilyticus]RWU10228.1 2-methylisocitrate lyase [Pedobacter chitinilyticus]
MKTATQTSKVKKPLLSQLLLILGLSFLLAAESYFGYQLYTLSAQQERLKEDYAIANNITFGVFSLDLWRDKLSNIVKSKIKGFKVSDEQKRELREEIEKQLHGMIDEVVAQFDKPQKSLGDKLKKFAFKQLVEPKELHAQVPSFARTIVNRINAPRAIKKLKGIATTEFNELADQIYDSTATAQSKMTNYLFKKYQVNSISGFNNHLEKKLESIRKVTYSYAYAMLGCMAVALCVWLPLRKKLHLHTPLFVMSLLLALVLLIVGSTVSIIEVDARLSSLELHLMGEKLAFTNQVLFFQSKSILGTAQVLIQQPKPDSITVGVLIILFVILLPILRMTARGIHMLCSPLISENKVTKYLAFESAKWDMADVMVVGILMTYIGLNGILQSQLSDLNIKSETLVTNTVNYTSLQPGFIIFAGYVACTIILSYLMKNVAYPPKEELK